MADIPPPPPGFVLQNNTQRPRVMAGAPDPRPPRPQIRFSDDYDALTRTILGEAGSEPDEGKAAVGGVIMNRSRARGMTPTQVVLEQNQFEPWGNPETASRLMSIRPDSPEYRRASAIARRVIDEGYDPTGGADHFYAPEAQRALGRQTPSWATGTPTVIGRHNFYNLGGSEESNRQAAATSVPPPPPGFVLDGASNDAPAQTTDPVEAVVDQGVNSDAQGFFTTGQDGKRVDLGADYASLDEAAKTARYESAMRGETAGYRTALAQEQEKSKALEGAGVDTTGFTQQLTAPINDELAGLAGFATQGLANLGRSLTGQDIEVSASERGKAASDLARTEQEQYQTANPGKALLGGVLGGFAFAPARGAAVPGLLGRLGQAGAVSGAYGVADGEGVGGRITNGLLNTVIGVGTAGVLEGGGAWARGISRDIERLRTPAASLPQAGERRVGQAVERALERDNVTPEAYMAGLPDRPEGRLPLEAGGENLLGLGETVAQAPGRARADIIKAVNTRSDDTSNRLSRSLADNFGAQGNVYQGLRERVVARTDAAKTGMDAIADTMVPLSDDAVRAFRSGLSTKAVRDAAQEATADLSPNASEAANRLFGLGDQVLDNPGAAQITIREAQDISYALKEAASRAYRGGFNSRGEALQNLSTAIRGNARETVPEYNTWLKDFGDASESIDALRIGNNLFSEATEKNAMSSAQLADRWGDWSSVARDNFRLGVGEAILNKTRKGGVSAMRRVLKDEEIAARVKVAFGSEEKFLKFMKTAGDEVVTDNNTRQLLGGPATARRVAGMADLNAQPVNGLDVAGELMGSLNPVALSGKALKAAIKALPRKDRSILGDDQLNGLLGRALTDEGEMTRLLNLLQSERGLNLTADSRVRALGLLGVPGANAGGQNRARGLLTANP